MDHAGGVGALVRALGRDVPVYVHEADAALVRDPMRAAGPLARVTGPFLPPPARCVVSFRNGDEIDVASRTMLALHTPGHTAGSSCLLAVDGSRRLLFTGDHLFAGGNLDEFVEALLSGR